MKRLSPFLLLLIIVPAIHFFLLKPVWENGLGPDDWSLLYTYKSLVGNNDPLLSVGKVWHTRGMYTTYQVYYIGLLEKTFGLDYLAFQTVNILFKTMATLSVYFLVKTIFKRKSLAFLTTILFAISYTSTGTFKFVVQGVDYLALASMNVFLITYYYSIKRFRYSIFLSPLLLVSLLLSPPRIYPVLALIPITEICLIFFAKEKFASIGRGLCRLLFIFAPLLLLALVDKGAVNTHLVYLGYLSQRLSEGKWYLFVNSLSGLGIFLLPFNGIISLFGNQGTSFTQYFISVLPRYLLFLFPISIIASILISQTPGTFFKRLLLANLTTTVILFFLINHNTTDYDHLVLTVQLLGAFILELGLFTWLEWKNTPQRAAGLLLPIWLGIGFSFVFLFFTWIIAYGQVYKGIHNYLMIPSMGLSLFLAAMLLLIYQKTGVKRRTMSYLVISFLILTFFMTSKNEINSYFINELTGWKASDQIIVQENLLKQVKGLLGEPALFFFDLSDERSQYRFYEVAALSTFHYWTNYQLGTNENSSCRSVFYHFERERLLEIVDRKGDSIKLKGYAYCISNGVEHFQNMEFDLDHFYAYKLKNKQLINEKNEIVDYLLRENK